MVVDFIISKHRKTWDAIYDSVADILDMVFSFKYKGIK